MGVAVNEPDAVLNLRTLETTLVDDAEHPYLRLSDGDTTIELRPCADGASPEAMNGIDGAIHELGALWDSMRRELHRRMVGEQG